MNDVSGADKASMLLNQNLSAKFQFTGCHHPSKWWCFYQFFKPLILMQEIFVYQYSNAMLVGEVHPATGKLTNGDLISRTWASTALGKSLKDGRVERYNPQKSG